MAEVQKTYGSELKELDFWASTYQVRVRLSRKPDDSYISSAGTPDADVVFRHVKEFLLSRRSWKDRWPTPFQAWWALVVFAGFLMIAQFMLGTKWPWYSANYPYLLWPLVLVVRRRNRIVLLKQHQAPPFWVRKKDDIILLLIGAVIGALVTWLVGKF